MLTFKRFLFYFFVFCLYVSFNPSILTYAATSGGGGSSSGESESGSSESESGNVPTAVPTSVPSSRSGPSARPTAKPTNKPTSPAPTPPTTTRTPTAHPTGHPTSSPTHRPTMEPTYEPSPYPTMEPTLRPTLEPTPPTPKPTPAPTKRPTFINSQCKYIAIEQDGVNETFVAPDKCLSFGHAINNPTQVYNETHNSSVVIDHYTMIEGSYIYSCDDSDADGRTAVLLMYNASDCTGPAYFNETIYYDDTLFNNIFYIQCGGVDCSAVVRVLEVTNCTTNYDAQFLYYSYHDESFVTGVCYAPIGNYSYQVHCDNSSLYYNTSQSDTCTGDTTVRNVKGCSNDDQSYYDVMHCHNNVKTTTAKPTSKPTKAPTPRPTANPTLKPTSMPTPQPTSPPLAVIILPPATTVATSIAPNSTNISDATSVIAKNMFVLWFVIFAALLL